MLKHQFTSILATVFAAFPFAATSDHVPNNLAQELNPNFIGCMMAVDDASTEFRDGLQSTCIKRTGDICGGGNEIEAPSEIIDCLYFENQRAIEFLSNAVKDLPQEVEKKGFFGHRYQKRLAQLLKDIEDLKQQDKATALDVAMQQSISMIQAVTTLFWFARETDTPLQAHVEPIFEHH